MTLCLRTGIVVALSVPSVLVLLVMQAIRLNYARIASGARPNPVRIMAAMTADRIACCAPG